ncbi:hypothetical protein AB0B63_07420 [Micromonospora sp. NPDC049081]|uniref:hypothetical protein n=1 Tax=Micromonospora sp. NPDC049081 TaxID=3155150 RepID=UPI0033D124E1
MKTWTVISTVTHAGGIDDTHTAHPFAAIPGRADVYGHTVHAALVQADTADQAITATRDAFRIAGHITPNTSPDSPILDGRWTVIGTADNGLCASHRVLAVIAGDHEVDGRYESTMSHRWVQVVAASSAADADRAGYKAAAETYDDTWH